MDGAAGTMKGPEDVADPEGVVTLIGPSVVPGGTLVTI
jgi:hypothetical protein